MSGKHSTNGDGKQDGKFAASLYRISEDRQDSIPTQRAWAQRVAGCDGLTVVGEFEDQGISGSDVNRPGLEDLIAFVRERFYAREPVLYLLVIDLDRFSRRDSLSTGAWLEQLRKHGLRYIITSNQRFDLYNALDRTLIALGSDFTREPELRAKSNHVLNGMAERARKGQWLGGPPPLGYRVGPDRHLIPGPEDEQEVVRWIFRTYARGLLTANGIARELTRRGIKTRWSKSGKWSRNTVLKILGSRTYLGCIVWGEQVKGKYHRLQAGMVVPREDKEDREQAQLLRGLKKLPYREAAEEDCIITPNAHRALIDRETFDACQRQREDNRENYSAPRQRRSCAKCGASVPPKLEKCGHCGEAVPVGGPGLKGNVWPLAGQMQCGHCGEPVWTLPVSSTGGKRKGTYVERARVCCCRRRADGADGCPNAGMTRYTNALERVIKLLKKKLADPAAVAEMENELERQLSEQTTNSEADRRRLTTRAGELDQAIATATRNLLQFPDDLKADAFEVVRSLKAERETVGGQLRDLDARDRENKRIDREEFRKTLAMVSELSPTWETREEAELLRATLRDLVGEVRLYFREKRPGDKLPRGQQATKRVLGRVEVDLTPSFADLLNTGSRSSTPPRRW
jgi:DNA invertase Pin-like site-specific DNA recombinase